MKSETQMRKNIFKTSSFYFHINLDFETHPIFKELDWIFIQKKILPLCFEFDVQLHALVMMDTHIHLLVFAHKNNENFFTESLATSINPKNKKVEIHCEPILSYAQYLNTYRYIYRNPIEAKLVSKIEDYKYSSIYYLLGKSLLHCQIIDQLGLIQNPIKLLNWINREDKITFLNNDTFKAQIASKPIQF